MGIKQTAQGRMPPAGDTELTGLNRTWGSADLSARRTFGRPKVRFNLSPPPPPVSAEKTAESPDRMTMGRSYGTMEGGKGGFQRGGSVQDDHGNRAAVLA